MFWLKFIIFLLFFPVGLGLLYNSLSENILSHQLISFTFFLFSIEQARMAVVDLKHYHLDKNNDHHNLSKFLKVIIITIIIELLGFYGALFYVGSGAFLVMISQLFFNFFAPLKVVEGENISLQNYPLSEKVAVLLADSIPVMLMILWLMNFYPVIMASIILGITLTFGMVKYIGSVKVIKL